VANKPRWKALKERLAETGYLHVRCEGFPGAVWRPSQTTAAWLDRLFACMQAVATHKVPARFDGSRVESRLLKGLKSRLEQVLDGLTNEDQGLDAEASEQLYQSSTGLAEPFLAKLLIVLDEESLWTRAAPPAPEAQAPTVPKGKKPPKPPRLSLSVYVEMLVGKGDEPNRTPFDRGIVGLKEAEFESPQGWHERGTLHNALREVFKHRNEEAHGAPEAGQETTWRMAWCALVFVLAIVEHNLEALEGKLGIVVPANPAPGGAASLADAGTDRWKVLANPSRAGKAESIAWLREQLPVSDRHRAWVGVEVVGEDGSVNDIDLLLLTPRGLYLIAVLAEGGRVTGTATTWSWTRDGRTRARENPLAEARRQAHKLAALLAAQSAVETPTIEALVFLATPADLVIELDAAAREGVFRRDPLGEPGIVKKLTAPGSDDVPLLTTKQARGIARALEQLPLHPSSAARPLAGHRLETLLGEGQGFQDFDAVLTDARAVRRRLRLYHCPPGAAGRQELVRSARREFELLQGMDHRGILRALHFEETERGPVIAFDHDAAAQSLDHYLRCEGQQLDLRARVALLRRIVEAVSYAHRRQVLHCALAPQAVQVIPEGERTPRVQVFDWRAGRRVGTRRTTLATSDGVRSGTVHPEALVEGLAQVYLAPEVRAHMDPTPAADVFSLGMLAWLVLTGGPPATSLTELDARLGQGGLDLSARIDGAPTALVNLIRMATHPDVELRSSLSELLEPLEQLERQGDVERPVDPSDANVGEVIAGWTVARRLGSGSTAIAYLATRDGAEAVLKVALESGKNKLLRDEGEVLSGLDHPGVVRWAETLDVQGRAVLVLASSGPETLRERLTQDGRLGLDLLRRWGDDLLGTVCYLHDQGIAHRDIKPDNLAVAPRGKDKTLHLVLFDFSLSRTSQEDIRLGTPRYLDPFLSLRQPRRWDEAAERFAAAVTLYEMATGTLPRWGDGRSVPALIPDEVTLQSELLEAPVREGLTALFRRAFARDPGQRHRTPRELLEDWQAVFAEVETSHPAEALDRAAFEAALAQASEETPVAALPFGAAAKGALEKLNVSTIRGLVGLGYGEIRRLRGVGHAVRRALLDATELLTRRFPALAAAPVAPPPPVGPGPGPSGGAPDLEQTLEALLAPVRGRPAREPELLRRWLGLGPAGATAQAEASRGEWVEAQAVAAGLGVRAEDAEGAVAAARARWAKLAALTALRGELTETLVELSGLASAEELALSLLARRRRSGDAAALLVARAVARAALEVEVQASPTRMALRRGSPTLVALAEDGGVDPEAALDWAGRLGAVADDLARTDPLPAQARVESELRQVAAPDGLVVPFTDRLVQLAGAAAVQAAVSSRLELYPRGLAPERALRLARGALVGVQELTEQEVRQRVAVRYPEARPLPARPALDALLDEVGLDLGWDGQAGRYRLRSVITGGVTTPSELGRRPTGHTPTPLEITPGIAEARDLEDKLQRRARDGTFLVLLVQPRHYALAADALARFGPTRISLEARLIHHLRAECKRLEGDWERVLELDAAGPPPAGDAGAAELWRLFQTNLVGPALEALQAELEATPGLVLLTEPGLLARYDRLDLLETLWQRLGAKSDAPVALHGLWVLVAQSDRTALPALDGRAIPLLPGGSQWAHLSRPWLENLHRAGRPALVAQEPST
jgi:serine/threonine protein kinase